MNYSDAIAQLSNFFRNQLLWTNALDFPLRISFYRAIQDEKGAFDKENRSAFEKANKSISKSLLHTKSGSKSTPKMPDLFTFDNAMRSVVLLAFSFGA